MRSSMKNVCILGLLAFVATASLCGVYGSGECGMSSPNMEAMKLFPCASAAKDENAQPSTKCCYRVDHLMQNPPCLCAAMLSHTIKRYGVRPEVAITIPKRCNLVYRPVGYQCGEYTLP